MNTEKIIKLTALNAGIAIFNVVLFSPGLLGLKLAGPDVFAAAFGITAILMSLLVFAYGNYRLIMVREKLIQPSEIHTIDDCIEAIKQNYSKKIFVKDIETVLEQIQRFNNKKESVKDILLQKFNSSEMSYSKFNMAVEDLQNIFFMNIKSILNKLNAFDQNDYNRISKYTSQNKFSKEFVETKIGIYNEYISFVKNAVEDNEEIMIKLDRFILELSKFNSLEEGELENMGAMKDIDELIKNIRYYK